MIRTWRGTVVFVVIVAAACAHEGGARRGGIIGQIDAELAGADETRYAFGGSGRGQSYDCSGYANQVLRQAAPGAFASLRALRSRPRATEYVERMELGGSDWRRVARVADLAPGDLIAWRHRPDAPRTDALSTGHVAFVVERPAPAGGGLWRVRVSDAARSGHSDDTRAPGRSGIGAGTILVATAPDGAPEAVAWSLRGRFEVPAAMALGRPLR